MLMGSRSHVTGAFDALSAALRPHAERWAVQLLPVPDEHVPRILEEVLRGVLAEVDQDYAEANLEEVRDWLRLVGHAIVERRHELLMRGAGGAGNA